MMMVCVVAISALALAEMARAEPTNVYTARWSGTTASAFWSNESTWGWALANNPLQGETTFQAGTATYRYDAEGAIIGAEYINLYYTATGFTFTSSKDFSTASVTGWVPATVCTYDWVLFSGGCYEAIVKVDISWTGQGQIDRFADGGLDTRNGSRVMTTRFSGQIRNASAGGTIGGVTLEDQFVQQAYIGAINTGYVAVCFTPDC